MNRAFPRCMRALVPLLLLALGIAHPAQAHKLWLLPSATVLSGERGWVGVDAAISNTLFSPDHRPLALDTIRIIAPDGSRLLPQHPHTGKYRSVFDLELTRQGSYRISSLHQGLFAAWEENGERRHWRGPREAFAGAVPAQAGKLDVAEFFIRAETFVSLGKPGGAAFAPEGQGLELIPQTHPNDLFAGETAHFVLHRDGKAAAGVEIEVLPGGTRYRNAPGGIKLKTDAAGRFSITWPDAGWYWLEARLADEQARAPARRRRLGYVATLEVLPQ